MSRQLAQQQVTDFTYSLVQRLLQEARYDQAILTLSRRIVDQPQDRMARLLLLLANISRYGSDPFERQIEELRCITDLSTNERHIVRRIFLVCFQKAERDGLTLQKIVYQRLIRRLLLNQPLDLSISAARARERGGEVAAAAPAALAPVADAASDAPALAAPTPSTQQWDHRALAGTGAAILLLLGFYLIDGDDIAGLRNSEPVRAQVSAHGMAVAAANPAQPANPPAAPEPSTTADIAAPAIPPAKTEPPVLKPHTRGRLEVARERRDGDVPQPNSEGTTPARAKHEPAEAPVLSGAESEITRASMLKQEPRFAAESIEAIDPGARVVVLDRERDWIKVRVQATDNVGYLRKEYLSIFNQLR